MKRGYIAMIVGAILVIAGVMIVVPSILTIYSAITSFSIDDIARIIVATILGWF